MVDLSTPLAKVVAPGSAGPLAKNRDVHTVGDFLEFLPRRYVQPGELTDLGELAEGDEVVVVARVRQVTTRPLPSRPRQRMLTAVITDGRTDVEVTFFNARGHEHRLVQGVHGLFAGTVKAFRGSWQLTHPDYQLFAEEESQEAVSRYTGRLVPIYLPAGRSMPPWKVRTVGEVVLDSLESLPDHLPAEVRERRGLPGLREMYEHLHRPENLQQVEHARHRLRYDEAFTVQAVLAQRRLANEDLRTTPRLARPGGLLEAFDARLPFELTDGQRAVSETIAADLAQSHPMHRLLQGEVGSGKTVVALRAMLSVIDSGGQAALLAPTEVLAAQHHRSMTAMLGDLAEGGLLGGSELGTRVTLLTGSQSTAARRKALLEAASGEAGIVVGTHALIQEHVSFFDLGLVVVDEQHRFGVEQRDALRSKGTQPPHVLVMTATPIPRTVAMTVFGDMETSTLTELPRGRSPIASHVVPGSNPRWVQRTWQRVAEEAHKGHQAYVVCPRIGDAAEAGAAAVDDDGEALDLSDLGEGAAARELHSVHTVAAELEDEPALDGLAVGVLHGRLAPEDKDAVMRDFAAGKIDVLVSTTVIEVGVDVPNATVMVVMDAERFGVSQLHQLRGRVGRGSAPGLCLLMTESESEAALERLSAVAETTDGFSLARLDLTQRREGDVLGARQSGSRGGLRHLSLLRDEDLILQAREDALALVTDDPQLERHPLLRQRIAAALDEEQAAYLERG
ncbi:ATP-dependent DNA helicase RecG [Oryzihumus sp.]